MRFSTAKIARFCCKTTARRARNHCKTCARSLGVRRASFGSVGEVLNRARCGFGARSAPGNASSRSSGLKGKKSGPFTLLVLMIGAVFRVLPEISRKIHGSAAG